MHRIEQAVEAAQDYVDAGMSPSDAIDCVRARFCLSRSERNHAVERVECAVADVPVEVPR